MGPHKWLWGLGWGPWGGGGNGAPRSLSNWPSLRVGWRPPRAPAGPYTERSAGCRVVVVEAAVDPRGSAGDRQGLGRALDAGTMLVCATVAPSPPPLHLTNSPLIFILNVHLVCQTDTNLQAGR